MTQLLPYSIVCMMICLAILIQHQLLTGEHSDISHTARHSKNHIVILNKVLNQIKLGFKT